MTLNKQEAINHLFLLYRLKATSVHSQEKLLARLKKEAQEVTEECISYSPIQVGDVATTKDGEEFTVIKVSPCFSEDLTKGYFLCQGEYPAQTQLIKVEDISDEE